MVYFSTKKKFIDKIIQRTILIRLIIKYKFSKFHKNIINFPLSTPDILCIVKLS